VITHEHSDHVKGIKKIWESCRASGNANTRAYMTSGTAEELSRSFIRQFPSRPGILSSGITAVIGEFEVRPFNILHDAAEPVGLVIQIANGTRIGIATDLGKVTHSVRDALRGVNGLIIESNHDLDRLLTCRYPWSLKQRIASSRGHLSNQAAAALVAELLHERLHYVVLGHLSEESNTPELAFGTMQQVLQTATPSMSMPAPIYLATACPKIPLIRNNLKSGGILSRTVATSSV
jgi:phosphoribosyl 1,2-cyclic phosphodiesterase